MVTGYNICPICREKYAPKNESKIKMGSKDVCMKCYRRNREIANMLFEEQRKLVKNWKERLEGSC